MIILVSILRGLPYVKDLLFFPTWTRVCSPFLLRTGQWQGTQQTSTPNHVAASGFHLFFCVAKTRYDKALQKPLLLTLKTTGHFLGKSSIQA